MVSFTKVIFAAGLVTSISAGPPLVAGISAITSLIGKRSDGVLPEEFSFLQDRAAPAVAGNSPKKATVTDFFKSCVDSLVKNKPDVQKNGNVVTITKLSADCITTIKQYNSRPDIDEIRAKQGTAKLFGKNGVVLTNMPAEVINALDG